MENWKDQGRLEKRDRKEEKRRGKGREKRNRKKEIHRRWFGAGLGRISGDWRKERKRKK